MRWAFATVILSSLLILACAKRSATQPALGPVDGLDLSAVDVERVKVGTAAPDFALLDQNGERVQLSSYRDPSSSPSFVVLVFYRGHW